jgi:serpin B
MSRVLHYPTNDTQLDAAFAALREQLLQVVRRSESRAEQMRKWGGSMEPISLNIANRLFGQTGFAFREPFQVLLKDKYAAPFETLNFAKDPNLAIDHINQWVESQTRQRIRGLIGPGGLTADTKLVLVNAIYLKAPWAHPFSASATKPATFNLDANHLISVPTMAGGGELRYAETEQFQAVELPYAGHDLSLVIVLPRKTDGLASLEKQLTPDMLGGKLAWNARSVTLYLPRFKLEPPSLQLSQALQTLGMKSAFNIPPGSANFDRMAPRQGGEGLQISSVVHKAFLNLDETGTEAAAATAVSMLPTSMVREPPKPVTMRVDHPFLFTLVHRESGTWLFLGHVADPR